MTDRYERSTNGRVFNDYRAMAARIGGDRSAQAPIFDPEAHPLPQVEDLMSAGWPAKKDRLARAIQLVALRDRGLDFADGRHASYETLQTREYHHLFPAAWLRERGYEDTSINRALNCALVTWKTNRNIAAKSPAAYVRERIDAANLGEKEVRNRLESHLIPVDALMAEDYDAFIRARGELVLPILTELC